jgi:hypothetical protein
MVNTLLMATSIGKAKGHKLLGNQCAKGRAAKLLRIFEFVKAYFTEQLRWPNYTVGAAEHGYECIHC